MRNKQSTGISKWWIKNLLGILISALALCLSAGECGWHAAWFYLAAVFFIIAANATFTDKKLLAERSQMQGGTQKWDVYLSIFVAVIGPLLILIVAGLDKRFEWSGDYNAALSSFALLIFILGGLLSTWSMAANKFFSSTVRLQHERGHQVASGGPYRYVRHPGYAGGIISMAATPFILGSQQALIPALAVIAGYIIRTALEDAFLKKELPGFDKYSTKVPYRLIPGLW